MQHMGWTNLDTWKAFMWLSNDYGAYNATKDVLGPEQLQKLFHNYFYSTIRSEYIDGIKIENVNFDEIFNSIKDARE